MSPSLLVFHVFEDGSVVLTIVRVDIFVFLVLKFGGTLLLPFILVLLVEFFVSLLVLHVFFLDLRGRLFI